MSTNNNLPPQSPNSPDRPDETNSHESTAEPQDYEPTREDIEREIARWQARFDELISLFKRKEIGYDMYYLERDKILFRLDELRNMLEPKPADRGKGAIRRFLGKMLRPRNDQ